MNLDHVRELAALQALGALEGDDARELASLLADCDCLRNEIAAFNDVAAALAQALPATARPSPELKEKILRRIDAGADAERRLAELSRTLPPRSAGYSFLAQAEAGEWQSLPVPGAFYKLLSIDRDRRLAVALGKLAPGARYPAHRHLGPEDVYMLSGDLHIGDQVLHAGDYHHAEAGTSHPVNYSEHGCTLLIVMSTENLLAQLGAR
jgi:putative transcriptional regulator